MLNFYVYICYCQKNSPSLCVPITFPINLNNISDFPKFISNNSVFYNQDHHIEISLWTINHFITIFN